MESNIKPFWYKYKDTFTFYYCEAILNYLNSKDKNCLKLKTIITELYNKHKSNAGTFIYVKNNKIIFEDTSIERIIKGRISRLIDILTQHDFINKLNRGIYSLSLKGKIQMSIDSEGRISTYYGACLNYAPDKTFPIAGLVDQSLGQVYKCRLLAGSKECYGCTNYNNSSKPALKDVFLNQINIELEKKNTGIIEVLFTYDDTKYKALIDLDKENNLLSIYRTDKEEQTYFGLPFSDKIYISIKEILTEIKVTRFSTRLKLLLIASKRKEGEFNKEFVASVLAQEYHPEMTLMDALHHCIAAYQEALEYKQLELPYRGDSQTLLMELLKAPSKQKLFPNTTDTYSLEEYYNSYINYILQHLRLTNIGWCRKELGFD